VELPQPVSVVFCIVCSASFRPYLIELPLFVRYARCNYVLPLLSLSRGYIMINEHPLNMIQYINKGC